jgi:hypothetical protein
MYFQDLKQYEYFPNDDPNVITIGWLDAGRDFVIGEPPTKFVAALAQIPLSVHTRGFHGCPFCEKAQGSAEKLVTHNGKTYAAPSLIDHYVTAHNYLPPQEFIDAVIAQYT